MSGLPANDTMDGKMLALGFLLLVGAAAAGRSTPFDDGWKFTRGDIAAPMVRPPSRAPLPSTRDRLPHSCALCHSYA
eukprot:SAG22_NODE_70_length_22717_cov_12.413741_18_plen_77_part_00